MERGAYRPPHTPTVRLTRANTDPPSSPCTMPFFVCFPLSTSQALPPSRPLHGWLSTPSQPSCRLPSHTAFVERCTFARGGVFGALLERYVFPDLDHLNWCMVPEVSEFLEAGVYGEGYRATGPAGNFPGGQRPPLAGKCDLAFQCFLSPL